jgi:serine phosphatase RsbU (regulator of sigma subunit)
VLIVIWGVREQGREGWLALPAVLLVGISQFQNALSLLHLRTSWFPFGVQVNLSQYAELLLLMVLFVLLVRRLLLSVRLQREMALDVKQAQEVQRVLLPEMLNVPGLTIESEYRPAREVGGDFFQIIPHTTDGSVLIVAGDVAGKGLQAGMLVALLVGAIRTAIETSADPRDILDALNRRLLGRGSANATCLALCIQSDGAVTLANAGSLPPYLNGIEVPMEGALPLGTIPGAEFSISHFQIGRGDTLTLISDGILEALDQAKATGSLPRPGTRLREQKTIAGMPWLPLIPCVPISTVFAA